MKKYKWSYKKFLRNLFNLFGFVFIELVNCIALIGILDKLSVM